MAARKFGGGCWNRGWGNRAMLCRAPEARMLDMTVFCSRGGSARGGGGATGTSAITTFSCSPTRGIIRCFTAASPLAICCCISVGSSFLMCCCTRGSKPYRPSNMFNAGGRLTAGMMGRRRTTYGTPPPDCASEASIVMAASCDADDDDMLDVAECSRGSFAFDAGWGRPVRGSTAGD
ncbi:hypothetical protein NP493_486g01017 [Ridgeia piscesae]|uniref:Uncharacterized protein n=1 Tax=Ridgeia piscesae TaxID=27915 RepID=A0AAD9KY29_RIDPI|nr:hypothetical protein NP493_486g01017 [Ridgeia piscesae]